jgi:hypothetical protein
MRRAAWRFLIGDLPVPVKKILLVVIFFMLFLFDAFAQPEETDEIPAQPEETDEIAVQPETAGITISAEYQLSSLNFSTKGINSGSILTWRDIYLNGAYVNVDFPGAPFGYQRTNIGVGFSGSFYGYWTDDDANNDLDVIYTAAAEAYLIDLNYEIFSVDHGLNFGFSHKLGLDFIILLFKNYNATQYARYTPFMDSTYEWEGLTNTFDHYTLAFYGGVKAVYGTGVFYAAISGQAGVGISLSFADWIHRRDLKHPVSFSYFGISFRGESDFEIGFRFKRGITLFSKALLMYEISPGLGLITNYNSDDDIGVGGKFMELSRASLNVGIKFSF